MGTLRIILISILAMGMGWVFLAFPWVGRAKGLVYASQVELPGPVWSKPAAPLPSVFPEKVRRSIKKADIFVTYDRHAFLRRIALVGVGALFAFGLVGIIMQQGHTTTDVAYAFGLTLGMMIGGLISLVIWRASGSSQPPMFSTSCLLGFLIGGAVVWKQRRRVTLPEAFAEDAPSPKRKKKKGSKKS